jgi:hypothetical protein
VRTAASVGSLVCSWWALFVALRLFGWKGALATLVGLSVALQFGYVIMFLIGSSLLYEWDAVREWLPMLAYVTACAAAGDWFARRSAHGA